MTVREPMFLGDKAKASYLPTPMGGALSIWSGDGEGIHLHLTDYRFGREAQRASALAALDTIAVAVQQALVALAPERFPQPGPNLDPCGCSAQPDWHHHIPGDGPDDPTDEPTDEPATGSLSESCGRCEDAAEDHAKGIGPCLVSGCPCGRWEPTVARVFAQAHPMAENELRAAWGDR